MKKYILFIIILMSLGIGLVKADNSKIYIDSVSYVDGSNTITVNHDPVVDGFKITFDLKFTRVREFIKYKVVIKNKDSEDYTLSSSDKSNDGYFKYDYIYENDNKVISANSDKIMYVVITYDKEVPDTLYKDGKYNETHSTNLSFYNNKLPDEVMKEITNPKTNTTSIIFIVLAILLSFIISFLLSGRKIRRYLGILVIGILVTSPLVVYAVNTLFITISTKVEIEKMSQYCTYDFQFNDYLEYEYKTGETWKTYYERKGLEEVFGFHDFDKKEIVDCAKENFGQYGQGTRSYCFGIINGLTTENVAIDDVIKSKEEGCYGVYGK